MGGRLRRRVSTSRFIGGRRSMISVFRHQVSLASILNALLDSALVFLVLFAILLRGSEPGGVQGPPVILVAGLFTLVMATVNTAFGLYRHDQLSMGHQLGGRLICAIVITLPLAYFVFDLLDFLPASTSMMEAVLGGSVAALASTLVVRQTFLPRIASSLGRRRVLVLGVGDRADAVRQFLEAARPGVDPIGYFPARPDEDRTVKDVRIFGPERHLAEIVQSERIDEIIVAVQEQRGGRLPMEELLHCRLSGVQVSSDATFIERVRGRVPLASLRASYLIYGEGFRQGRVRVFVKRAFDLIVSLLLLALVWPIMVIAALAIRLESRGPVIYRQERVTQGGRPFNILKFRSMAVDAEKDGRPQWAGAGDARITRVGRFMRRTRIDELPQLLNVLFGEMSFVGPRPERPYFVQQLNESLPYYGLRHTVKAGLTGWAQVRYQYTANFEDTGNKLEYDLYYVKNHSLFLDLVILVETVRVVIFGEGAR
jgi:sugar transferase (PEP-CTERM system associated)